MAIAAADQQNRSLSASGRQGVMAPIPACSFVILQGGRNRSQQLIDRIHSLLTRAANLHRNAGRGAGDLAGNRTGRLHQERGRVARTCSQT